MNTQNRRENISRINDFFSNLNAVDQLIMIATNTLNFNTKLKSQRI